MKSLYKAIATSHKYFVFNRRVKSLADTVLSLLTPDARTLLDVGSGSGDLAQLIKAENVNLDIRAVDIFVRPKSAIPTEPFDGTHLPYADGSFDFVLLSDVLHHTSDYETLLRECARVAKQGILIKDHIQKNLLDRLTLRFMDWLGNAAHGVNLEYRYLRQDEWTACYKRLGLRLIVRKSTLRLYPYPFSLFFERGLHFVDLLSPTKTGVPIPHG